MALNTTFLEINEIIEERRKLVVNYGIYMLVALSLYLIRTLGFFAICLRIASNLHNRLFNRISKAPMHFFHSNFSGIILSRFAGDMSHVDRDLAYLWSIVLGVSLSIQLLPTIIETIFFSSL